MAYPELSNSISLKAPSRLQSLKFLRIKTRLPFSSKRDPRNKDKCSTSVNHLDMDC